MKILYNVGDEIEFDGSAYTQVIPDSYPSDANLILKEDKKWMQGFISANTNVANNSSYRLYSPIRLDPSSTYSISTVERFLVTLDADRNIIRNTSTLPYLSTITLSADEVYVAVNGASPKTVFTKTATSIITYTISFISNTSTSYNRIIVIPGDSIGELPTPTKSNYEFLGWYWNDELITSSFIPTQSLTLEAKWESLLKPTYEKQTWVNDMTPVDEEHMNHIESGIADNSESIVSLGNITSSLSSKISNISSITIEDVVESDDFSNKVDELISEMDLDYDAIAKSGWQGKKVAWIGDSLTAGEAWCSIVNKVFNFDSTNVGVGGTTVSYEGDSSMCMMSRLTGEYSNVTDPITGLVTSDGIVTPTDLDIMFFQGATNDWARNHPIGERLPKYGYKTTEVAAYSEGVSGSFSNLDSSLNITTTEDSSKICFKISVESGHKYVISNGSSFKLWTFDSSGNQLSEVDSTLSYTFEDGVSFIVIQADVYSYDSYTEDTFVDGFLNGSNISTSTAYKTSQFIPVKAGITVTSTTSLRFVNYYKQGVYQSPSLTYTSSFTISDGVDSIRFSCSTDSTPTLTFSETVISEFTINSITTEQQYIGDKTYVYDSCYWLFENLKNYETKLTFQVIALGTGFGQMKNREVFGSNTYGVLNALNKTTIEYGDVLVDAAGMWGWKGINIGREMGINTINNSTYIPDGLHFTTSESQKRAAEVIINFLLAHEPRNESL